MKLTPGLNLPWHPYKMRKRGKWRAIMDLEVQDPKNMITFSSKDLVWSEIRRENNDIDRVALIPSNRVLAFIKGEETNPDAPCTFVRRQNKKPGKRDTASLRYELYHCSYGPEDKRGGESTKRRAKFPMKRGCQCRFTVKVMVKSPQIAILTYNMCEHEDLQGCPCHGQRDTSGNGKTLQKPKLSKDIVAYVESCYFSGVSIDSSYKMHIKRHVDMDASTRDRDFFLSRKDILNIYNRLSKGKYQLHEKDEMSVNLWHQKRPEDFFFYQKPNGKEVPFIIGIQTKWMLESMVKLSHNSIIAMDSTFSTNKYGYQLYTLVAFDGQQSGVPVAWVLAERNTSADIALWLEQLMLRCYKICPDWKVNAFMVDDALAEISALRRITGCDVILCIWHVRRAWKKNVYRLAKKKQADKMYEELGFIMKHTSNEDVDDAIHGFLSKWKDEEKFLDYFRKNWVAGDKFRMWVKGCREFPHANQDTNNAVESYHCYLKTNFLSDKRKKCARRMDWLLYMLLCSVEPCYRYKEILKEEGYLNNYRKEKQMENSVEKARRIPDSDCCPHESTPHAYWVRSQTDGDKNYLVKRYSTNFIVCECPWSIRGNICKHAIKVNWLFYHSGDSYPLLHQDAMPTTFNDPPEISMEPRNLNVDIHTTPVATDSVDADVEALQLAREELYSYLQLIKDSPPATLSKTYQLIDMVKKMLDEANNLHVMDFDFTVGLDALDSSLKRKKSFLSPTKKRRRRKQNNRVEIDLNIHASEYEPFQFQYLKERGRLRANKALPMVSEVQHSTTVASSQSQREMQHHQNSPDMPEVQQSSTLMSGQSHGEFQHDHLMDDSPIADLREVQPSTTVVPIQGHREMQYWRPTFTVVPDYRNCPRDRPPSKHAQLIDKSPVGDLQEVQPSTTVVPIQGHREMQYWRPTFTVVPDYRNCPRDRPPSKGGASSSSIVLTHDTLPGDYRRRGGASSSAMRNPPCKGFSFNDDQ